MHEKNNFKQIVLKKNRKLLNIMKIYVLMTLLSIFSVFAENTYSQSNSVTLKLTNVTLGEAIDRIERTTDYLFLIMDDADRELRKKVSVSFNDKSINEILAVLLKDTNLSYSIVKRQITIRRIPQPVIATKESVPEREIVQQTRKTISGTILDANQEPIIGANIVEKGTTNGTVSDINGNFSLSVDNNATIIISYIGYMMQEISVSSRNTFNIILQEDSGLLEELVVVGYGVQKKETVTGAISTLSGDQVVKSPVANISNSIVGKIPGITSLQTSGEPGFNESAINIRGVATLNEEGQSPLIVIDGIQSTVSFMNVLDPNEIENISVLKDASATAVYGVKGANGVIIITTKRGRISAPQISLSYNYGLTRLATKFKMLDSYSYALFRNEAYIRDNEGNYQNLLFTDDELWKFKNNRDYTPEEVAAMDIPEDQKRRLLDMPSLYYQSHDYWDEQFTGITPQQQYNINVSGGGDKVKYFASIGHFSQEGIFKVGEYDGYKINPSYNRYNFRSNVDIDAFKNFKISVDVAGQFQNRSNLIGTDEGRDKQMLVLFYAGTPFMGPGLYDGKLISTYIGSTLYPNPIRGGKGDSPLAGLFRTAMQQTSSSNMNTNLKVTHLMDYITPGLSVSGTFSYNDTYLKSRRFQKLVKTYIMMRDVNDPSKLVFFDDQLTAPYSITDNFENYKMNRTYAEGKLNYGRTFGKHTISALALYNINILKDPNLQFHTANTILGSAARVTYDYDQKYMTELNIGYNGSENFPDDKRFGFFPAVSAGWTISRENFFPKQGIISFLKIRGSYGEVGNDQIGGRRYLYLPDKWRMDAAGTHFGVTGPDGRPPYIPGAEESMIGNPDVTWERAKKGNIGLEAQFFNNRLSFTGDIFSEKRDNILWYSESVPSIVSRFLPPANIGKVDNTGYELQLSWMDQTATGLTYRIEGHVNYAKNKVIYMDEPPRPYEWMNGAGFSIGQYRGFISDGFYNNSVEVFSRPYGSADGNKVQPGDIRYIDIDGDGKINENDRVPIGNSNLPRYSFGSNLSLGYKGFEISALFIGSAKGSMTIWSHGDNAVLTPFRNKGIGNAFLYQFEGRWTEEKVKQNIIPTYPRASTNSTNQNVTNPSDFWLMPTDFVKLKNVEIAYTFSSAGALKRLGVAGIRLYVNGDNLYTWKSKKLLDGFDPEQADALVISSGYLYPPTQVYNFGVNINF